MLRFACLFTIGLVCTGCATIVNGSRQTVGINSTPNGAVVRVDGGIVGKTPWSGTIERKESTIVIVEKEGYEGQVLKLSGESSGWVLGNIFTCLFFGTTTDFSSGGAYEYVPGYWHVALEKPGAAAEAQAAPANPVSKRESAIKRYVLANYPNLVRQIVSEPPRPGRSNRLASEAEGVPEYLRQLRSLMGMDDQSDEQMRVLLRPAATTQLTPDTFAEAVILMLPPESKTDPPKQHTP